LKVMWCITGAGCLLEESFDAVEELKRRGSVKVTTALTRAGEEVVRIYGLQDRLRRISPGSHYEELLTERSEGASGYRMGRLARGLYDLLFVSPASANTVAKLVAGIADTMATNAVAQAVKGGVRVLIVPVDQEEVVETPLPTFVDRELCVGCRPCRAEESCRYGAVKRVEGKAWVDLALCHGCRACVEACPMGAVKSRVRVKVRARRVDLENVERLKRMEGVEVLRSPAQLLKELSASLPR
jgi:dihydromethanopterin reductase (acceptor)